MTIYGSGFGAGWRISGLFYRKSKTPSRESKRFFDSSGDAGLKGLFQVIQIERRRNSADY